MKSNDLIRKNSDPDFINRNIIDIKNVIGKNDPDINKKIVARDLIVSAYPSVFQGKPTFHWLEDIDGGMRYNAYSREGFRTFNSGPLKGQIVLSRCVFDHFANNDILADLNQDFVYWTFGELVRSIYHEYIHYYQFNGMFGFEEMTYVEREFQAYYYMHQDNGLPDAGYPTRLFDYFLATVSVPGEPRVTPAEVESLNVRFQSQISYMWHYMFPKLFKFVY